jgi:hypothetical protein
VGLIARAFELTGVPATLTSWSAGITRRTAPPRATFTKLQGGLTLGHPGDTDQHQRILMATLVLLEKDAPLAPVYLDES